MPNFNIVQDRNNALIKIPRFNYKSSENTIRFCQTGCNLEFSFSNIESANVKNDGNFFSITPGTPNTNNYIMWNGSGTNGQVMTRFDLNEINFFAPTKDIVSQITPNNTIQYYFTFVNSENTNIMIVISIIGQSNNTGAIQTNGYKLLNSLAEQIPLNGDSSVLGKLSNFNLGSLLPNNKSFFSTLISDSSIQYISLTNIVDVPITFFNNLISRVVGSTQAYESKANSYKQSIPQNPPGSIIFYTENTLPIGADQAYVCNSNCDRVVGDAASLPVIGTRTTTEGTPTMPASTLTAKSTTGKPKTPSEECEEEEMWPGGVTNVRIKSASGKNIDGSNKSNTDARDDANKNEIKSSMDQGIIITLFILGMVIGFIAIFFILCRKFNLPFFKSIFTREFWDIQNAGWISLGFFAIVSLIVCLSFTLSIYIQQFNIENKPEGDKTDIDKIIEKKKAYIPLIVGISVYTIILVIIIRKSWNNISSSNGSSNGSFGSNRSSNGSFGSNGSSGSFGSSGSSGS